jgi:hypothetical protein
LLNSYGAQGWELVGIMNQSYRRESDPTALYGYTIASYFLKRPAEYSSSELHLQDRLETRQEETNS